MGFLDAAEMEEKTQSLGMQNRELEEQLAALEEEGAHLAATLREVREKAQELNDSLSNSLGDYDLLQQELQAEQFARAELQERVEVMELELQDTEAAARPRFVVFPVNRGTLGRGSHAVPQARATPPVIAARSPAAASPPRRAIAQPPVAGLLEAPPAASYASYRVQEPPAASYASYRVQEPPAASHVSYRVQAPPSASLPVIGSAYGEDRPNYAQTAVLGPRGGGWNAGPPPSPKYSYGPTAPVQYLAQPVHAYYSPAHSVSRPPYGPASSVPRQYYSPAHSVSRQYHVVG